MGDVDKVLLTKIEITVLLIWLYFQLKGCSSFKPLENSASFTLK